MKIKFRNLYDWKCLEKFIFRDKYVNNFVVFSWFNTYIFYIVYIVP